MPVTLLCHLCHVHLLLIHHLPSSPSGFSDGQKVKNPLAMQETQVPSLGQEDPLEKEMATHSSIVTWKIPGKQSILSGYAACSHKEVDTTK